MARLREPEEQESAFSRIALAKARNLRGGKTAVERHAATAASNGGRPRLEPARAPGPRLRLSKPKPCKFRLTCAWEPSLNDLSIPTMPASTEVEVLDATERWSEYRLADGTVLRVKPIMIAITRVDDAEDSGGEPIYNMKSTLVTDVRGAKVPPHLG